MIEIGAFAAKTHLSAILDKVCAGEEVLITKRGRAVARLVPAEQPGRLNASISKLLRLRGQVSLQGEDWKTLRDKGRR